MKRIIGILTVVVIVWMTIGCNRHIAVTDPVYIHDTIYTAVSNSSISEDKPGIPDSASIKAILQCDSLGNVYLRTITQLQGEIVSQSLTLEDNLLTIEALSKTREKKESVRKDSIRTVTIEKPVPYPVETITNRLTSWQCFQIWIGRIILIAAVIYLIIVLAGKKLSFITKLFKKN